MALNKQLEHTQHDEVAEHQARDAQRTGRDAMPTNQDPESPEMQSLENSRVADHAHDNFQHAQLHFRSSGLQEDWHVKQVWFDAGFACFEMSDGRKVAIPSQELGRVEFGPNNLVWD